MPAKPLLKSGWGIAHASLAWLLLPVANAQSDAEILEAVRACQRVAELSSRQACYDRALPPIIESVDSDDSRASPTERGERAERAARAERTERVDSVDRAERVATVNEPEPPLATMVQIVEVQSPSLGTTRFRAADGRIFVRENANTRPRWPDTPFDVEIRSGVFGSTYLMFPESRLRIRVTVRN
jgi:hypothetical protein